jgi:integrase
MGVHVGKRLVDQQENTFTSIKQCVDYVLTPAELAKGKGLLKHKSEAGLYCRIMAPSSKAERGTRSFFSRITSGPNKGTTMPIGQVNVPPWNNISSVIAKNKEFQAGSKQLGQEIREAEVLGKDSKGRQLRNLTLAEAFDNFINEYIVLYRSQATLIDYKQRMKPFVGAGGHNHRFQVHEDPSQFRDLPLKSLDTAFWKARYREILHKYPDKMIKTQAQSTLRVVRSFYEFAVGEGYVDNNPITFLADKRIMQYPEPAIKPYIDDFDEFFHALGGVQSPQREYIKFTMFVGFRSAMMQRLNWGRINVERRAYIIRPGDVGAKKIKEEFEFPINDYIWSTIIKALYDEHPKVRRNESFTETDWVFHSPKKPGRPLVNVRGSFGRINKGLKLRRLSMHVGRYTISTVAGETGAKGLAVARLLAHSPTAKSEDWLQVTAGYAQSKLEGLREEANVIMNEILRRAGMDGTKYKLPPTDGYVFTALNKTAPGSEKMQKKSIKAEQH